MIVPQSHLNPAPTEPSEVDDASDPKTHDSFSTRENVRNSKVLLIFGCRLEELQKKHREVNNLYNALGASFESAPQFSTQFIVAMKLGEYIRGSADSSEQALRIPTNLKVSLLASLVSGCYSTGMAVSLLMGSHVPLARRTCVGIVIGKDDHFKFQSINTTLHNGERERERERDILGTTYLIHPTGARLKRERDYY